VCELRWGDFFSEKKCPHCHVYIERYSRSEYVSLDGGGREDSYNEARCSSPDFYRDVEEEGGASVVTPSSVSRTVG
jgi:hypothetical protein